MEGNRVKMSFSIIIEFFFAIDLPAVLVGSPVLTQAAVL